MTRPATAARRVSRTATPRPFLKWAGGKTQLLAELGRALPARFAGYHEPFVGSGALYFHLEREGRLRERGVRLNDRNAALVECYLTVRDDLEPLLAELARLEREHDPDDSSVYYARREEYNLRPRRRVRRAALFVYLNRTGYNGLYRVNRQGRFNVPCGRYRRPQIRDEANLRAVSRALRGVELGTSPFEDVLERARPGDLVYFDPPYDPSSATSRFTSYTAEAFGPEQQQALAEVYAQLARRGCHVLLSNAATPRMRELYAGLAEQGLELELRRVEANRAINSRASRRGRVDELLVVHHASG